ncbi:MAG TPA: DUF58 domain-containing protein [Actinocrinis sp.]|nr:DUF58 domain-containing protein [Actinocrinis sp.]
MATTEGHTSTTLGRTLGRTLGLVPEPARRAVFRVTGPAGLRVWARYRLRPLGAVTGLGWSVLAGSAAGWLAGDHFGWYELCLASVIGLLCFLVCWASVAGRTALRVAIGLESGWVRAGERAEPTVQVTNLARRGMLPVALEVAVGPPGAKQPRSIPVPNLGRNASAPATRFPVPAERRGVIEIGPATIVRADPLGLIRRTAGWPEVRELVVWPRTVGLPPLSTGLMHDLEGRTSDKVSVSDLEFHTLRDYVRGDDRRHIHWRSSARVGSISGVDRFVVRQFQQTRRTHLLVVVDGHEGAYPDPEDFELAVSAGASLTVAAMVEGLESTLLVADRIAREETPQAHLDACARAEFGRGGRLAVLAARGFRSAPHSTVAVLVTGAGVAFKDLRRARAQLRPQVLTQVLRIDPARRTGMLPDETMTVLSLRTLNDLPALVGVGGAR